MKEREPKLHERAYEAICFVCDYKIGKRPWVYIGNEKFRHKNRCEPLGTNWNNKFPDSFSAQLTAKRKEEEMAKKTPVEQEIGTMLVEAAEELNEVLGIEPPIDTEVDEDKLRKLLKDAAKLLTEEDEISEGTQKVLETLEGKMKIKEKVHKKVKRTPEKTTKKVKRTPEKTTKKEKVAKEPSNKLIVYYAYKDGETDIHKLLKKVHNAVKDTTVKGWLNAWKHGNNLPAGA